MEMNDLVREIVTNELMNSKKGCKGIKRSPNGQSENSLDLEGRDSREE